MAAYIRLELNLDHDHDLDDLLDLRVFSYFHSEMNGVCKDDVAEC